MRLDCLLFFCTAVILEVSCYNYKERQRFFHHQHIRSKRHFSENSDSDSPPDPDPVPEITFRDFNPNWDSTWTDKLKKTLFLNYDKFARPTHQENATEVLLGFTLHHIEMDEQRSIMTPHIYLTMSWYDDKLKWNSSEFGGLKALVVSDHEVWQPHIYPYNSASGSTVDGNPHFNCLVFQDGYVLWLPSAIFFYNLFCPLDLRKWPFDTQVCQMKMGCWTHDGLNIDLEWGKLDPEYEFFVRNSEWKVVTMDIEKGELVHKCCPQPYFNLQFNFTLERRSPTYESLIITPASAVVLMTLSTFWLPPTSGSKLVLGGVTIFITCLFFLYFMQKVSAMAGNTPLIILFYSSSLSLISFSVVFSVVIMNISRNPKTFPIPWILKSYLKGWLGKCLFPENFIPFQVRRRTVPFQKEVKEGMTNYHPKFSEIQDPPEEQSGSFKSFNHDWLLVAIAMDRIAFLVYCLLFIVFAIAYSV